MPRLLAWLLVLSVASSGQTRKKASPPSKPATQAQKAAAPPPTADKWPVESLRIQGNRNYTPEQILAVAGLRTGQMAGKTEFEAARDRLIATGMFESVGYRFEPSADGKGYAASFQVVEVEPVYSYKTEDLPVPAVDLEKALKQADPLFGAKVPATKPVLDRYVAVIEGYLARQGKAQKVAARLTADTPDNLVIVFRPAALPPAVAEVHFTGNSVIPATALQNAVHGAAIGSLYNEKRFQQILDLSVRQLYEARGRIRVRFTSVQTERAKDVNGLIVKVTVDEGQSYELGDVRIEGVADPQMLFKAAAFRTGDIANFDDVKAGVVRIEQAMRRNGYMKAATSVDRRIDDAKKRVDLTVRISAGPQFMFGRLNIEGLDIVSEPEIRKMWALKEGKPFNVEYPDYFLGRIREDGVFDNLSETRSSVKVNDGPNTVDVTLTFKGAPPPAERRKKRQNPGFSACFGQAEATAVHAIVV